MNTNNSKTRLKTLFLIFGAVALYAVMLSVINFLNLPYKGLLQLFFLLIIAVSVYVFTRYNLYVYTCDIEDNKIIFTSKLGEAEKIIAVVSFDQVKYIAPFGHEILYNEKEVFRYNAKKSLSNKDSYVLVFYDAQQKLSKITFDADKELLIKFSQNDIKVF